MVHMSFSIVVFFSSFESVRRPQKTSLTLVGGLSEVHVEWSLLSPRKTESGFPGREAPVCDRQARQGPTARSIS